MPLPVLIDIFQMRFDGFSVEMAFCLEIQKKNISQILKNKP